MVRRGRRGPPCGRRNNASGDRQRAGQSWRKDRAPPVSRWGGQAQFFVPNRPVPPAGRPARSRPQSTAGYRGTQFRSYADVVRQGSRNREQGTKPVTPTDPKFGRLVRKFHKVIKVVHHLQNVTSTPGKPEPQMISRMVDILGSMIKPASPCPDTLDLIVGNAKNWGHNTLIILEDHYKAALEKLLLELPEDWIPEWKDAFGVATKWARRNLPRIKTEEIDHAEALVMPVEQEVPQQQGASGKTPEEPRGTSVRGTAEKPTEVEFLEEVVVLAQDQVSATTRPTQTVATMTDQGSDQPPTLREQEAGEQTAPLPPLQEPPKAQRPQGSRGRQNPCVIEGDSIAQVTEEASPEPVARGGRALAPMGISGFEEDSLIDWLGIPMVPSTRGADLQDQGPQRTVAQVHQTSVSFQESSLLDQDDSALGTTSTPKAQLFRAKRHINTDRKMVDWGLSVWKKWLIIGDSNLSRLPTYSIQDLQIESYPGANFRHAEAIMSKATCHTVVEKVVLSFGLNCRGQKAKETAIKQMQAAVRVAKKQFPYAEIWIPIINYSSALPATERGTLYTLNVHIDKNMPFIPALPGTDFHTEKDLVHWTRATARAMLDHWVQYLNLKSP